MKKRRTRKPKAVLATVAVVLTKQRIHPGILAKSDRAGHGDWACFVGDRTLAIEEAIKARADWQARNYGPYQILVGQLTEEIVTPTNYKTIKLKAGAQ